MLSKALAQYTKAVEVMRKDKEIREFKNEWVHLMGATGSDMYNPFTETYTLRNFKIIESGYTFEIEVPAGLTYKNLEEKREHIEDYFGGIVESKRNPEKRCLEMKLIIKRVPDNIKYVAPKVKPYEAFIGIGYDLEPVIINMNEFPHILDTGATGAGKSKLMDQIITALICSNSEFDLEMYLIQSDKDDLVIYEDCKQVRAFATTLEEIETVLLHIIKKIEERKPLIKSMKKQGLGSNIKDYNKRYPTKKLSYVWVVIDEFSSLMPDEIDEKEEKIAKKRIIKYINKIAQIARSYGIFLCMGLQRATADKLPSFVKSQCNLRITLKQNNKISSQIAIDTDEALFLPLREAIFIAGEKGRIKTMFINDEIILEHIRPHMKENHRTLFDDLKKLGIENYREENNKIDNRKKLPKQEYREKIKGAELVKLKEEVERLKEVAVANEFDKVNKSKNKVIGADIPGYVPYDPPKVKPQIEKIDLSKTEKPKKKNGREKVE